MKEEEEEEEEEAEQEVGATHTHTHRQSSSPGSFSLFVTLLLSNSTLCGFLHFRRMRNKAKRAELKKIPISGPTPHHNSVGLLVALSFSTHFLALVDLTAIHYSCRGRTARQGD